MTETITVCSDRCSSGSPHSEPSSSSGIDRVEFYCETHGDAQDARILGSGSISCLGLTEEQGAEAERRRGLIGFRSPPTVPLRLHELVERQTEVILRCRYLYAERLVEKELASWGECGWTCRDLLVLVEDTHGGFSVSVR